MTDSTTNQEDLGNLAMTIIDSNMYMVLGIADAAGQPWVSPVYYASAGYREFYWVSSPEVRHSQNIAIRPQLSMVIFDSKAPIGTGQGCTCLLSLRSLQARILIKASKSSLVRLLHMEGENGNWSSGVIRVFRHGSH